MKTSSRAIYIVGTILILVVAVLVVYGGFLFVDFSPPDVDVNAEYKTPHTQNYGGNLDLSGKLGGPFTLTPEGVSPKSVPVLRVYANETDRVYFRVKSFGDYADSAWKDAREFSELLDGVFGMNYLAGTAMRDSGLPCMQMQIAAFGTQYALPDYLYAGAGFLYKAQKSDVLYAGETEETYTVDYVSYHGEPIAAGRFSEEEKRYRKFVYANYLNVPESTAAALGEIVSREGFSAADPDIIEKVASYVRTAAVYNAQYPSELDSEKDAVVAFLTKYKQGLCRHYASAAALIYRMLGIPARYTIGYVGTVLSGEETTISADGAHAWTEVYLDGVGWIHVDATGGGGVADVGGSDLDRAKEERSKLLETYAESLKKELEEDGFLSDGEKAEGKRRLDEALSKGMEALSAAGSYDELMSAYGAAYRDLTEIRDQYAKKFSVVFAHNVEGVEFPADRELKAGAVVYLDSMPDVAEGGRSYRFAGWSTEETPPLADRAPSVHCYVGAYQVTENVVFYGVWVCSSYAVRLSNAEEGTVAGAELPIVREGISIGSEVALPRGLRLERGEERFLLVGWTLSAQKPVMSASDLPARYFTARYRFSEEDADGNTVELYALWAVDADGNDLPDYTEGRRIRFVQTVEGRTENFPADVGGYFYDSFALPGEEEIYCYHESGGLVLAGWTTVGDLVEEDYLLEESQTPSYLLYPAGAEAPLSDGETVFYAVWRRGAGAYTLKTVNEQKGSLAYQDIPLEREYGGLWEGAEMELSYSATLFGSKVCMLYGWTKRAGAGILTEEPDFEYLGLGERYRVSAADADGEGVIALYAVWAEDADQSGVPDWLERYHIGFENPFGGEAQGLPAEAAAAGEYVLPGEGAVCLREGLEYALAGWTEAELNREEYLAEDDREPVGFLAVGDRVQISRDTVFYAVWRRTTVYCTIDFRNTAEAAPASLPAPLANVPSGTEAELPAPVYSESGGFVFYGWSFFPAPQIYDRRPEGRVCIDRYFVDAKDADEENVVAFYAVWASDVNRNRVPDFSEEVLVRFVNPIDGETTGFPKDVTAPLGAYTLPGEGAVCENGEAVYLLIGWSDRVLPEPVADELPQDCIAVGDETTLTGDVVFYAVWRKTREKTYSLRAESSVAGSLSPEDALPFARSGLAVGESVLLPSDCTLEAEGEHYLLFGWSKEPSEPLTEKPLGAYIKAGGSYSVSAPDADEGGTIVLYALWAADRNRNGTADFWENLYYVNYLHTAGVEPQSWPENLVGILSGEEIVLAGKDGAGEPLYAVVWREKRYALVGWTAYRAEEENYFLSADPALYFPDYREAGSTLSVSENLELYAVWRSAESGGFGGDSGDTGDTGGGTGGGTGGTGGGTGGTGGGSGTVVTGDLQDDGSIGLGPIGEGESEPAHTLLWLNSDRTGKVYLRYKSFGDYAGDSWREASSYPYAMEYGGEHLGAGYLAGLALGESGRERYELSVTRVEGTTQYFLPSYLGLGGNYTVQSGDVVSRGKAGEYVVPYYDYSVLSGSVPYRADSFEELYRAYVRQNYLSVPESTRSALGPLIAANGLNTGDVFQTVVKVADYVSHAAGYDVKYDRALDESKDIAAAFLTQYKSGICQHYATAATVLYRMLGIPARYTIGYVGETVAGQTTEVLSDGAHAWVEVYLEGFGWAQVEVTGSRNNVSGGSGSGSGGSGSFEDENLRAEKEKAKDALRGYGEEKKSDAFIEGLSPEEGEALRGAIDGAVGDGCAKIEEARSAEEVREALEGGKAEADGVLSGALREKEKEAAVRELREYAAQKKEETSARQDLTDGQKQNARKKIDEALPDLEGMIYAAEADGVRDALEQGKRAIDSIADSAGETSDLQDVKDRAKAELAEYAQKKKEETMAREDLDSWSKNDTCNKVGYAQNEGERAIDKAVTEKEIEDALKEAKARMDELMAEYKRALIVTTASLGAEYDGKFHSKDEYTLQGSLEEGHSLHVSFTVSLRDVGTAANKAEAIVVDRNGKDVSDRYYLLYVFGNITVSPKRITVAAKSARKQYDGAPLTFEGAGDGFEREEAEAQLAAGDRFAEVVVSGSIVNRGRAENVVVSVKIVNAEGQDVTGNYIVERKNGTLRVE